MPGAPQRGGHTARDRERVAVGARLREPQRRLGVGHAVQRERGAMLRIPAAVRPLRVLLLQARGVGQHHRKQVRGARRAVHGPAKPLPGEEGQVSGVVDVRVGQHHGVDRCLIGDTLAPVPQAQLLHALEQSAVEQNAVPADGEEMHRAGHGAGGAEKLEGRAHPEQPLG